MKFDVENVRKKLAMEYFDSALGNGFSLDQAKEAALGRFAASLLENGVENSKDIYSSFKDELEEKVKNLNSNSSRR